MKPHLKVNWCIAKAEASFLARMEDVLDVYAQPHDQQYPVVCFDERPCFLIADTLAPIPTQEGRIAREHYSYEKNGSCCLLAAIEPKQGKRVAAVYEQRTKKEYTQSSCRGWRKTIRKQRRSSWCRTTLNTHQTSSFYEHLAADEAKALAERFGFHYTPKSAS